MPGSDNTDGAIASVQAKTVPTSTLVPKSVNGATIIPIQAGAPVPVVEPRVPYIIEYSLEDTWEMLKVRMSAINKLAQSYGEREPTDRLRTISPKTPRAKAACLGNINRLRLRRRELRFEAMRIECMLMRFRACD